MSFLRGGARRDCFPQHPLSDPQCDRQHQGQSESESFSFLVPALVAIRLRVTALTTVHDRHHERRQTTSCAHSIGAVPYQS